MKKLCAACILLTCLALGTTFFALHSLHQIRQEQVDLKDLSDKIEQLQRNAALKKESATNTWNFPHAPLNQNGEQFPRFPVAPAKIEHMKPAPDGPPKGLPFEFNGQTYYYIPL